MPSSALPPELVARRRRARLLYGAVVTVLVLAAGLTAGIVIGTGESAHATLVTGTAAPAVPGGTVRPAPTQVWRTADHAAGENPLWVGTAVTWSAHTLAGRDATSGAIRWSYTRTDLSICDAAQFNGRAFVLFGRDGDCDELSTFDSQTGRRGWFRTLPDHGAGTLQFGGTGLLISYATSFHAMTTAQGYDRFPSVPTTAADCRFTSVVAGTTGIVAAERCDDGQHLAMWSNDGADSQPRQVWRVDAPAGVTAVAETNVAAFGYDPVTGTLTRYSVDKGTSLGAVALDPATTGPAGRGQVVGSDLLLDLGDRAYDLSDGSALRWSVASVGPPTITGGDVTRALVPTSAGAALVDFATGQTLSTYTLPASSGEAAGGPLVYAAGAGLLVADGGLAYLR